MTEEEFREEIRKINKNYEGIIRDLRDEILTLKTELEVAWTRVGRLTCANIESSRLGYSRLSIDKKF